MENGLTINALGYPACRFSFRLEHHLAELVAKDECRLVGKAKLAAHRQHTLALHFVAKKQDREEVGPQAELVRGEQRSARDAEIFSAVLAAKARRAVRAPAIIDRDRSAMNAGGFPVRFRPAEGGEQLFDLFIGRLHHVQKAEGLGGFGEEKVLGHDVTVCDAYASQIVTLRHHVKGLCHHLRYFYLETRDDNP